MHIHPGNSDKKNYTKEIDEEQSKSIIDSISSSNDNCIARQSIHLRKLIHLSLELQPNRMEPDIACLKNFPLNTFIIELMDGFYASQTVAVFLKSNAVITGMSSNEIHKKDFDFMVNF